MSSGDPGETGIPGFGGPSWDEPADPFADHAGMNMFTQEIENVDASDWDVDSDSLWGDAEADTGADIGDGSYDIDFPG